MLTRLSTSVFPNMGLNSVTVMTLRSSWVAFTCWEHLKAEDYTLLTKGWRDHWAIHQLSLIRTPRNLCLQSFQDTFLSWLGFESTCVRANNITACHLQNHRHMPSYFSTLPTVSFSRGHWTSGGFLLRSWNEGEMLNSSPGLRISLHRTWKGSCYLGAVWS